MRLRECKFCGDTFASTKELNKHNHFECTGTWGVEVKEKTVLDTMVKLPTKLYDYENGKNGDIIEEIEINPKFISTIAEAEIVVKVESKKKVCHITVEGRPYTVYLSRTELEEKLRG